MNQIERDAETKRIVAEQFASQWACLSCFAKFPMGKLKINGGIGDRIEGNEHGLNCPHCRGMKIHPIDDTFTRHEAEKKAGK